MIKPAILALAATLALSAAPAMAGSQTLNTVVANGWRETNTVVANGTITANTVVANGLRDQNTVVANGYNSGNTPADIAVARTEVHLVGATGAPVPTGGTIVLRLVAVEYLPE